MSKRINFKNKEIFETRGSDFPETISTLPPNPPDDQNIIVAMKSGATVQLNNVTVLQIYYLDPTKPPEWVITRKRKLVLYGKVAQVTPKGDLPPIAGLAEKIDAVFFLN